MPALVSPASAGRTVLPAARPAARRSLWRRLADRLDLIRQRRALAALDARLLADIGLSREDAEAEARRPFWDGPVRG
ncbi:DUF1127 domain-containing protein [Rubrimonas cliftonensis]|uniref:Uncharacterized conserved protein YjiS, DUF1127 family n=1 Tax=Rubrimonas cliftonensis TaxID=89524 RepID=A0A1H4BX03_9RHOB|nr:DUF1127 domain-containing protein [Rubrimonas cliftonensis]SEA52603.1 Uncharacterized conserved protein YjiS, DUF1127 family [Rubrimonas cliftonensis]